MMQMYDWRGLGADFEVREVKRWVVHCSYCGTILVGDTPQTDKAWAQLKRLAENRKCCNPNCVSNGGPEKRRQDA